MKTALANSPRSSDCERDQSTISMRTPRETDRDVGWSAAEFHAARGIEIPRKAEQPIDERRVDTRKIRRGVRLPKHCASSRS